MLGAIVGDIVGSLYEIHNVKTKDFDLFPKESTFTDDSVMTTAVAKWLMEDPKHQPETLVESMQGLGREYPNAGYGGQFIYWVLSRNPKPYYSYGNGAGMRVSPVGLYAKSIFEARSLAQICAEVTHNHPEGIKGAQAIASAVFFAKAGKSKSFIKEYIVNEFGYDLNRTIEEIRENYLYDETCPGTVSEAIIAFLEGNDFEDVIRLAISLGGDSDTIACMAGAIAACYYPIPQEMIDHCRKKLSRDPQLLEILDSFEQSIG